MEGKGFDIFDLSDFELILVGTEMVGEKIRNNPRNKSLGEDCEKSPHLPKGPLSILPLSSEDLLSIAL